MTVFAKKRPFLKNQAQSSQKEFKQPCAGRRTLYMALAKRKNGTPQEWKEIVMFFLEHGPNGRFLLRANAVSAGR